MRRSCGSYYRYDGPRKCEGERDEAYKLEGRITSQP